MAAIAEKEIENRKKRQETRERIPMGVDVAKGRDNGSIILFLEAIGSDKS